MPWPTVSAVIPTYNYGRYVVEAVESALAQRYDGAIEVIVVDDGSTDDTRERLAKLDGRIRYVYQENRGLSGARNTGIREAKNEWIALLDSDDLWHPDKTALQIRLAEEHDLDAIGSPVLVRELPRTLDPNPPFRRLSVLDFLTGSHVSSSAMMVRRRCFDAVGLFDEQLRSVEDRDMWLRLADELAFGVAVSPNSTYRQHDGQMNRNAARMLVNFERVLAKFFAAHPHHAKHERVAYSFMWADAAIAHMEEGARRQALRYMARSLRFHPWEPPGGSRHLSSMRRLKILARALVGERLFTAIRGSSARAT